MKLLRILAATVFSVFLVGVALHALAGKLLLNVDESPPLKHILLENWSGDIGQFVAARAAVGGADKGQFCTFIFEHLHVDPREHRRYIHAAHVAGLDTATLRLIPVPYENPRTLHIAGAVLDSAAAWGWDTLTVVTAKLHTARSGDVYRRLSQPRGLTIYMVGAAYMEITEKNWFMSWEGIETVLEELLKKVYYDTMVLRRM